MKDIRTILLDLGWDESITSFFLDRAEEFPNQVCYTTNASIMSMGTVDLDNFVVTNSEFFPDNTLK